jgi:hypothetical protein
MRLHESDPYHGHSDGVRHSGLPLSLRVGVAAAVVILLSSLFVVCECVDERDFVLFDDPLFPDQVLHSSYSSTSSPSFLVSIPS